MDDNVWGEGFTPFSSAAINQHSAATRSPFLPARSISMPYTCSPRTIGEACNLSSQSGISTSAELWTWTWGWTLYLKPSAFSSVTPSGKSSRSAGCVRFLATRISASRPPTVGLTPARIVRSIHSTACAGCSIAAAAWMGIWKSSPVGLKPAASISLNHFSTCSKSFLLAYTDMKSLYVDSSGRKPALRPCWNNRSASFH
mmetsp:Transcript_3067/g.11894  ORF Transcript_3067/g.11894 Transcript_3067/m.11894 type:complete len:200 (+) Transcript_3067:2705-3304(+)